MTFFESLLVISLVAIVLLQISRRLDLPYPAMLAAAGVIVALVPGAPAITIDPQLALALFIAPALVDAAFDFPVGSAWRLWRPLVALAVVAVLLTTAAVAAVGMAVAGLPLMAAVALGAIVAPPDAAAATSVLRNLRLPQRTVSVLKGESLLNDALALLLFNGAVALSASRDLTATAGFQLALAAPGGVALGIGMALAYQRIAWLFSGTLGGRLFEFVNTFLVWIVAERLGLSAVLCVVAFAMTIARTAGFQLPARTRVHSFAVWETVVFSLNVVAFLLMGMQARVIVAAMPPDRLREALAFAGLVVVTVIAIRLAWVMIYNRLAARFRILRGDYEPATLAQGLVVGWCGMRGLVTLATAFALPAAFPERDLIVLSAFAVVLATLVLQGATLPPLIRFLRFDGADGDRQLAKSRRALADAALSYLDGREGKAAAELRDAYEIKKAASSDPALVEPLRERKALALAAIGAERQRLKELLIERGIGEDVYEALQEELDWRELAVTPPENRVIEEG